MEEDKSRLELLQSIERNTRQQNTRQTNDGLTGFLDNIHPLIKIIIPLAAAFLWFQGNFATTKMYQDQETKIIEVNLKLDTQYKEVKQLIDQRYQESLVHSNDNRDRMMSIMTEIKDNLKSVFLAGQAKH
jgi:hypothetical protein